MPPANIVQTLQKYATIVHRPDELAEKFTEMRSTVTGRVERLETTVGDLRERVARLASMRDADRAQSQAELARFLAEVERTEVRLSRLLPRPDPDEP